MSMEKGGNMEAEKALTKYDQTEVGYVDYAVRRNPVNAVCQTCRWFCGARVRDDGEVKHDCHVVDAYPLDIVPTGWCNQWTERPAVMPEPDPGPVIEVETMADDDLIDLPKRVALSQGVASLPDAEAERTIGRYPSKQTRALLATNAAVFTFKAIGGGKWFAAFTNNFKDRQAEIISTAAHARYVARVKAGAVPMPELWVWHTPGTRAGKALFVDRTDHFTYAVGEFDTTPEGKALERFAKAAAPGEITLSHGFTFEPWAFKEGVYDDYNVFEISVLPAGAEANPYTAFTSIKENDMNDEKRKFFQRAFGDEAEAVISSVEALEQGGKAIANAGAAYKEYADHTPAVSEKAADKEDDMDYKAMYGDLVKGMEQLIKEFMPMQKAMSKAITEIADLKAIIADGLPKHGMGSASANKEDPDAKMMADEVGQKQKPADGAQGWNAYLPGLVKT